MNRNYLSEALIQLNKLEDSIKESTKRIHKSIDECTSSINDYLKDVEHGYGYVTLDKAIEDLSNEYSCDIDEDGLIEYVNKNTSYKIANLLGIKVVMTPTAPSGKKISKDLGLFSDNMENVTEAYSENDLILHYNSPTYNQNKSYAQNSNRYAHTELLKNPEEVKNKIKELQDKGCKDFKVYNRAGKKLNIDDFTKNESIGKITEDKTYDLVPAKRLISHPAMENVTDSFSDIDIPDNVRVYKYNGPGKQKEFFIVVGDQRVDHSFAKEDTVRKYINSHDLSLVEDLNRVSVETDDSTTEILNGENGEVSVTTTPNSQKSGEVIEPVDDELKDEISLQLDDSSDETEIEDNSEEETIDDADEFVEESFNKLVSRYLTRVYENVNTYNTTSIKSRNNRYLVEGKINFKSGKSRNVKFLFESKGNELVGKNTKLSDNGPEFSIKGSVKDKKFITESLKYSNGNKSKGIIR